MWYINNLNKSSVVSIAIDLHNRSGISIEYGYHASKEYNHLSGNNLEEGFISRTSIKHAQKNLSNNYI